MNREPSRARALAIRFAVGPAVIACAFFFFEKSKPFAEVWKPLALYFALAVPAFFLIDILKRRMAAKDA